MLHGFGRYAPWEAGFDFTPPTPGPGEVTGPPDFVGIGVQKAGTTWWHALIEAHPKVAAPPGLHKERHFLSRFGTQAFGPADVAAYQGWFPRTPGTIAGEWTPDYVAYPWVPPVLAQAAPDARLLVLLRDPVERYRSGLAHQRRFGASLTGATVADAVCRGLYHQSLTQWLGRFGADRMLVLQYERCVLDPGGQLARTYRFLDLDDDFRPPMLEQPVSAAPRPVPPLDPDVRRRLVDIYTPDVTALARLLPDVDVSLWPNFPAL